MYLNIVASGASWGKERLYYGEKARYGWLPEAIKPVTCGKDTHFELSHQG
jgi:hypothetical protein